MSYQYTPLTSDNPVLWTPSEQEELADKAVQFQIAPPTPLHEDRLTMHLSVLGLTSISENDIRATIIDQCFEIFGDEKGEENANFLDSVWDRQQIFSAQVQAWMEQERERRIDIARGVDPEKVEPNPMPDKLVSAREASKQNLLIREISSKSMVLRQMIAEQQEFGAKSNNLMVKMHVLPTARNFEFEDGRDDLGLLSDNDIARIKQAIGLPAFDELILKIDSLYSFSQEEAGNSSSPSETESDQIISDEASGDLESSNGNSKASDTPPAQPGASEKTTKPS